MTDPRFSRFQVYRLDAAVPVLASGMNAVDAKAAVVAVSTMQGAPAVQLGVWSGKGAPVPLGSVVTCADRKGTRCVVTGYKLDGGWLMATGHREADPSFVGDLAGMEILYPDADALAAMRAGSDDEADEAPAAVQGAPGERDAYGRTPSEVAIVTGAAAREAWRAKANAYLGERATEWTDSYVLATLRHTLEGSAIWAEARDAGFFETRR